MIYILIVLSIFLFSAGIAGWIAAPYVPTRKRDVARFLELAKIKTGDVVYDLGCGDGRVLSAAAKQGVRAVGFEISILNYLFCKVFRRGIKVKFKNFFAANFSDADLVYMFLSQKAHNKMGEILKKQLRPGARIITYVWPIDGLVADKVNKTAGQPNLYLYKI